LCGKTAASAYLVVGLNIELDFLAGEGSHSATKSAPYPHPYPYNALSQEPVVVTLQAQAETHLICILTARRPLCSGGVSASQDVSDRQACSSAMNGAVVRSGSVEETCVSVFAG
jgi:hypothetical protein